MASFPIKRKKIRIKNIPSHQFLWISAQKYYNWMHIRLIGEKLVQLASDSLVTEILIHPQLSTLKQCIRNLLASFTRHRHVIHAGYTLSGCGSWVVQVNY